MKSENVEREVGGLGWLEGVEEGLVKVVRIGGRGIREEQVLENCQGMVVMVLVKVGWCGYQPPSSLSPSHLPE
ncbi:hypothetical protein Acr_24g0010180 [Actinidia rufa]|uniref:Uncharacterized protein n=1 Tax=Actinidia rufa TaxID=165716 RepID=A0A7J0GVN2_9ERIC|nr:hypothetical protein Acr_24g0010180 [Actinidia rufa]